MKSIAVIKKNLKLLLRSKGSAMVVLLAPLLIVLVIGFGFSDNTPTKLNIGLISPVNTELTQRYINNLNTTENNLIIFKENEKCIQAIRDGTTVSCIIFTGEFKLSDSSTNEIIFYVDESRINMVHRLIASLSFNLNLESEEVSQELTSRLLEILSRTAVNVDSSIDKTIALKAIIKTSQETSEKSSTTLENFNTEDVNVDLTDLAKKISDLTEDYSTIRSKAGNILESGNALLNEINSSIPEVSDLEKDLKNLNTSLSSTIKSGEELEAIKTSVLAAERSVAELKKKLAEAKTVKSSVISDFDSLSSSLDNIETGIDDIKTKQESILEDLKSFSIKSAENIVNPVTTKIEQVSSNKSRLTYAFPYLLMLIVLFVGIMLSSTIVYMEKDSRAFFRTFTTPARNSFFVWMTYLTSAIVILVQAALVLIVVNLWLKVPVFSNFWTTFVVLLLSLTVFVLLGMFVGHLFSSSEGITMSTIALGSVMIFLSNLILPLETLSPLIQQLARFNPYVIASENIRKAMLFGSNIKGLQTDLIILLAYALLLLGITLLMIKIMSSKYLSRMHNKAKAKIISVPEDHYLKIDEKKPAIKNIEELVVALTNMPENEYSKFVKPKNVFADWISTNYKAKRLALSIRGKGREKTIELLQKYLKKR